MYNSTKLKETSNDELLEQYSIVLSLREVVKPGTTLGELQMIMEDELKLRKITTINIPDGSTKVDD